MQASSKNCECNRGNAALLGKDAALIELEMQGAAAKSTFVISLGEQYEAHRT